MGKPAARIGDMHVCPMVTPGVPPVPHVGGPLMGPGVPTVLIGGMPAAVMGDMCTCVGPPSTIVLGSTGVFFCGKTAPRMGDMTAHGGTITMGLPTVLIGETMAGGGGSGGAGSNSTSVIKKAVANALSQMPPENAGVAAQVTSLKEAAAKGMPFCEKCAG
jgi:uncharacterized Zn-binding protein involved in type VI secretion